MDYETGYPKEGFSTTMRGGKIWGYENATGCRFLFAGPSVDKNNLKYIPCVTDEVLRKNYLKKNHCL